MVDESGIADTGFGRIPTQSDIPQPTSEEIVIAKLDGVCPRCNRTIEVDTDGALCQCGFSF